MPPHRFDHLLPSTFEERGASVPFTSPALAQARVRKDWRDRLEITIGQFSGGPGAYVIPWSAVPEMISLTTHDTLLHEEVSARKALDPHSVRMAALEIARGGLAGPEVAETATKILAADEEAKSLGQVVIIIKVIEEAEPSQAKELLKNIRNPDGQQRVREALVEVAARFKLDSKAFDARLSELGIATYDVGAAWSPLEGRLRRLIARLGEFSGALQAWGAERLGESAEQAAFAAEVSAYTLAIANRTLQKFDALFGSPRVIVSEWNKKSPEVRALVTRLAWLLDGWQNLVEIWFGTTTECEQVDALAWIVERLPFIPTKEVDPDHSAKSISQLFGRSSRWVRANEDWKTGEMDLELMQRLESLKAKEASA